MKTQTINQKKKSFAKFLFLAFTLPFIFNACMKEVEFDEELLDSKLIINGFICADSIIKVNVAVSKPIPGVKQNIEWIDNAKIKLYVDDAFSEELQNVKPEYKENEYYDYDNEKPTSEYQSVNNKAQIGKKYKIEVEYDGFEKAWAETTIPSKTIIDTVRSEIKEITEYGYTENRKFYYVKFTDPQNTKNFYRLSVNNTKGVRSTFWNYETEQYEASDSIRIVYVSNNIDNYINSDDPVLTENENADDYLFGGVSNDYNLFTDDLINGQQYELSFNNYYYYDTPPSDEMIEGEFSCTSINLMTLSQEAYLYIKSSYEHWWNDDEFLAEPVQVYTNINNGIGIFAGYSLDEYALCIGEYPIDSFEYIYNNYY